MSEEAPSEAVERPPGEIRPRRGPGRVAVALLGLLSLVAVGLAGYLFWRVEWANPVTAVETRLEDRMAGLQATLNDARSTSEAAIAARIATVEETLGEHGDALDASRTAFADAVAEQRRQAPPDARDWRLAEVEYLLRVANNRLLLERDATTAERLLGAADVILEELDDYALFDVRALLAEERLALREVGTANAQTLFLRIEALKDGLGELPARIPEYFGAPDAPGPDAAAPPETPASAWEALLDRLSNLYEFRTREGIAPRPLLRPDEAVYLEFHLRLAFERAQLGALRNDQLLYRQSLASARGWIDEHLDTESPAVQGLRKEIEALLRFDVEAALPDISRSLARLRELAPTALTPGPERGPLGQGPLEQGP
ncbi:MAG: uroporphyrinogen-III C-methyltransferase [Gammaproteobacteria bacterium]|nr:uroporphyrinogen-III C-methyltransferase [Gammaproteobacteria bacterium]